MGVLSAFRNARENYKARKWDKIYVLVDIHGTIFFPTYHNKETYKWYDNAKEALQLLSQKKNVCLILWSSTHDDILREYIKVFEENGIHFDYVNCNPEVESNELTNVNSKLYFNVGIDDKFGFDPVNGDWKQVMWFLNNEWVE